ncbi:MAG: diguanylate cyclase [Nitrospinota bacterium]|nr:MAG: diguanylate cyclase [Nitrospinota bacterium]
MRRTASGAIRRLLAVIDEKIKKYTYLSSDIPTTEELERVKEARERVLLVIKTRWVLLGIFLLYGLYAIIFYSRQGAHQLSPVLKAVPVAAFLVAVAYNAWYHYSYRWFAKIRRLNLIQLLFDLLFVTVIVHFSGGAISWFWAMYFVLILEAAFLGESIYDPWAVGIGASLLYGALLTAEFYGVIPPIEMPYENNALQQNFNYEMLKWAWVSVMSIIVAGIGSFMMRRIKTQEEELRRMVITDSLTGVYNRGYFFLRLNSELQRAKRYGRTFSLLILDVDNFKKFNDTYGHLTGDFLLKGVAEVIRKNLRRSEGYPKYDVDVPCRYGGEEFAIILPESTTAESSLTAEQLREKIRAKGAVFVAEKLRREIESFDFDGKTVTVSIGVATFPEHGATMEKLIKAADDAMYTAKKQGKNRVVIASRPE